MSSTPDILCIGSVLWDVIGRTPLPMQVGSDVPGRITRVPGGVAMNIAMALARAGMRPALLTAIGSDAAGDDLLEFAARRGLLTDHIYRSPDLPTDCYMAIEGAGGLVAAVADAHSLEAADDKILRPLLDGPLGSDDHPFEGRIALDGNLTEALLAFIARSPAFAACALSIAPASPGKVMRLLPLLGHPGVTLYVNKQEAGLLMGQTFASAAEAGKALVGRGARRVLVTDGGAVTADTDAVTQITARPPEVLVTRVTGAGDTFMAAHIAAEARGLSRDEALEDAQRICADYVSGETPL